jgi:twitching motility protein PilT
MTIGQPIDSHVHTDKTPDIDKYFKTAVKNGASDLHLKMGMPPIMRISNKLKRTTGDIMTEQKIEDLIFEIMNPKQKQFFFERGALDFAYQVGATDRFRINAFRQRNFISISARRISSVIPPFEKLHLPSIIEKIADTTHEGLVLVIGPTGSGKSTTLASMIDYINRTRASHIITIEDPLEFLHVDQKSIVSQREIGIDVPNYEEALRSIMRQDPDVVLIGEMRDRETLSAAMRAAETGHLVFGTLHANNASQTIQRILDLFPPEERELARATFSQTIQAIISQQLLPGIRPDTPRVPAVEIMINTPIIRKLIGDQREGDIASAIRGGSGEGMLDITESLRRLVEEEYVDLKVAMEHAPNVEELKMAMKGIRATSGGIL